MRSARGAVAIALLIGLFAWPSPRGQGAGAPQYYYLGRPATEREIAGWDIDIAPDGAGLPPGSGTAAQGQNIYAAQCAACHGASGEGGIGDRLVGGRTSLGTAKPVKTIGSYWPYATTIFDYIRRAMPLNNPESLTDNQVYAVTAYLLWLNGIVSKDTVLDAQALPKIKMPNHGGFTGDSRPDVP